LNRVISPVPLRGTVVISSPLEPMTPQGSVAERNGDGLACVREAGLDALARDLDAAAAGHFPPNGQP
jgi:hypothetical protein